MRFEFNPDELVLAEAVGALLAAVSTPAVVRAAWAAPAGSLDRTAWVALSDMGVFDVLVPVGAGGLGLDWRSLVLVLEATGRFALPGPVVEMAAVVAPLAGSLPRSGSSQPLVSVSLAGAPAVCGADADFLVVDHEGALLLLPRAAVAGRVLPSVDGARRLFAIEAIDASAGEVLAEGPAELEAALDRAALGVAAQLIGLSQTMLDLTVAYVADRHQFGVPVGSFQAVKHHLAGALMELSFARPAVYRAAWSLSAADPEAASHVAMAKAMASDAAGVVGRAALQCHGAIGYTVEYDFHLYLKRAWALSQSFGSAAWHRSRVASWLGLSV
jgi:alkylation response protein AidB-like acyl-CoA dehydrogenase